MNEYKGRVESYSRECLRKESQIKELQGRIETGDGCKYHNPLSLLSLLCPNLWPLLPLLCHCPLLQPSMPSSADL